ncbi:WD40-repeat-containing domain protein [Suillus paluster]|uniref:WD40-repeat-containing domain protein n=1 Tax=Suillus paluster TaxID=48578 RepID=UPI001B8601FA|nr:WD40-repeat-containing domain protein [Suillus paluster]KAG1726884.1 WD40-repeat-containing domain protein [Suillus paluster]
MASAESSEKPTLGEASTSTTTQFKRPTPKHKFEGHENAVWSFVFLHDNVHIVSGSWDGTMRKWNCDTGCLVRKPWRGMGGSIRALALSPDGKTIACGRDDGSIQRWTTDGEMIESVWMGHSDCVRSLSWSPSGDHIASGSDDETILIQKKESGKFDVGPISIKTEQEYVCALAYSPSGDKIASGGSDKTICIWHSKTGKLVVGHIGGLGLWVTSVAWSTDSTKLYTASDKFARVFDSVSGMLLHRFEHDNSLYSIALSPNNNVLACVGVQGITRLWDTESHQPLGQPFCQDHETLCCVSFSRDGRYVAYGGDDRKLILWMVKDIVPVLAASIIQQGDREATKQETRPESPSSSCLDADATNPSGGNGVTEEVCDDPYNNFFQSSQASLPSVSPGFPNRSDLSPVRRFWNTISRHRPSANESTPEACPKHSFFARRAHSNPPTTTTPNQPTPEGRVRAGEEDKENDQNVDCSTNTSLGTKDKGKQRDKSPADSHTPLPDDPTPPLPELDNEGNHNIWKRLMRTRGKDHASAGMAPAMKRPEVVEVYAVRGFQGYVALTHKKKSKLPVAMCSMPITASGSSQTVPSAQGDSAQAGASLQLASGQPGPSPQATVANSTQYLQVGGGPVSPSHFVTTYHTRHDSDSRSSIEGTCNRFLDKICFPCGHFHD